jgi:23S rRNA pseudouridine2605 synthase
MSMALWWQAMRLAKFLSNAGVASRRAAEQLIRDNRVTVDGTQISDPATDVDETNAVEVDGRAIAPQRTRAVYAVNKPAGVVSTARDTHGRSTVVSLVPSERRLYPVGRLDIDTTGLILLTDDGELAHRLTHPSFEVEKTYRAAVANGPVRQPAVRALQAGVELDDGRTAPAKVRLVGPDTIELTIHEGRKRQVKRMCEHVGHPVRSLERIRFGPLELGRLKPGESRRLTEAELRALTPSAAARGAHRDGSSW